MLPFAYYTLALVALLLAAAVVAHHRHRAAALKAFFFDCAGWLIYVFLISQTDALTNFSLPPRLPLLVMVPVIVSIIVYTGRPIFASVLRNTPVHLPILAQSFRILVELLIYWAFTRSLLPVQVTFEGTNYDITVGISALLVGLMAWKGKLSLRLLMAWNIYGLIILAITAFTFMRTYYSADAVTSLQRATFIQFPYILVAAVMLPVAVGLHVVSIRQLLLKNKQVRPLHQKSKVAPAVPAEEQFI